MTGLLDTSVLVGLEQRRLTTEALPAQASVSVLTLEELWLGVLMAAPDRRDDRRTTYALAAARFHVLAVDVVVARTSAQIRAEGRGRGRRYDLADSLIAATALVHELSVYTQDAGMLGMLGVDVRLV